MQPLPLVHCAAALDLEFALGDVVADAVAGDVVQRVVLLDVAWRVVPMTTASSTSQSVFCEPRGMHDVVVGADDAARRLVEDDRLGRDRRAGFGGVVGIVEADGDEFARLADAGAQALPDGASGRLLGSVRRMRSRSGRQASSAMSGTRPRQIADLSVRVDEARLLVSGCPNRHSFMRRLRCPKGMGLFLRVRGPRAMHFLTPNMCRFATSAEKGRISTSRRAFDRMPEQSRKPIYIGLHINLMKMHATAQKLTKYFRS